MVAGIDSFRYRFRESIYFVKDLYYGVKLECCDWRSLQGSQKA